MSEQPSSERGRPRLPSDYGVPEGDEGMLAWDQAHERLAGARNYWIATVGPDAAPQVVPVWGVWDGAVLYFDMHPETRTARNFLANPAVAVHLEDGNEAVIVRGVAGETSEPEVLRRIGALYTEKYGMAAPGADKGFWVVWARVIIAWTAFPRTATRWRFAGTGLDHRRLRPLPWRSKRLGR
jgi:hypothetical protein